MIKDDLPMSLNVDSDMVKVVLLDCKKNKEIREIVKVKIECDKRVFLDIAWAHLSKQGGSMGSLDPS